jgi:hypothetical protein
LVPHGQSLALQCEHLAVNNEPFNLHAQPSAMHGEGLDMQIRPSNLHDEPFNLHGQPSTMYGEGLNLQIQPSNLHDEPSNLRNRPFNLHEQPFIVEQLRLIFRFLRHQTDGREANRQFRHGNKRLQNLPGTFYNGKEEH